MSKVMELNNVVEVIVEEKVFMNEIEAQAILERMLNIATSVGEEDIIGFQWDFLYDLDYEDKVIAFVNDDIHQVDVVQLSDGSGYAFNFWKGDFYYGQIEMNNSWEVTGAIQ